MTINRPSTTPSHTQAASSTAKKADLPQLRFPLLVLICLVLVVTGIGYSVYDRMKQEGAQQIQQNLAAIATLKVEQISNWLRQSMNTASTASNGSVLADLAGESIKQSKSSRRLEQMIHARKDFVKRRQSYGELALLDANGKHFQNADSGLKALTVEHELIRLAIDRKQPALGNIRLENRPDGTPYVSLPIAAPLIPSSEKTIAGVLWIGLDVSKFLFPLIQIWPAPSETAETLLIRRDGDDVLFLNELRHRKGEPLSFRTQFARLL